MPSPAQMLSLEDQLNCRSAGKGSGGGRFCILPWFVPAPCQSHRLVICCIRSLGRCCEAPREVCTLTSYGGGCTILPACSAVSSCTVTLLCTLLLYSQGCLNTARDGHWPSQTVQTRGAEWRGEKVFIPMAPNQFFPNFYVCKEKRRAPRLLPVPVKRPSAFHLYKIDTLDGFKSYPAVSPVSLRGPLLFHRIPLAVPALYLKVTAPAKLLSRSMQLLQLLSCLVLPWTAAFNLPPGCSCVYTEHPNSSFPLLGPVSQGESLPPQWLEAQGISK